MINVQFHRIFLAGSLPHPLSLYCVSLRNPATCVRAGPGRHWQCHNSRPSSRPRTGAASRVLCP